MSSDGPRDRPADRPTMAEALASLKEGLRDTADPLYDGWKLKKGAGAASDNATAATAPRAGRAPLQMDTVRVRVIRYQVFPKWALVAVAALIVFAGSAAALRFGLRPSKDAQSTNSVPAHDRAVRGDRAGDRSVAADVPALPGEEASGRESPPPEAESSGVSPREGALSPATKIAPPATRRRAGAHETGFFRDPGF